MVWTEDRLSRRELLARAALRSAQAGAVAVLSPVVVGGCASAGPRASSTSQLPELTAASSKAQSGGVQVFRSRPDLHPPVITIKTSSRSQAPGYIFTESHAGPAYQGPMIIDSNGDLVWTESLSPGTDTTLRAFNVRAQPYKGAQVVSFFVGAVVEGHGQGHYELYDSSYTKIAEVHGQDGLMGDLHEFLITPRGTALFTCFGQSTADTSALPGGRRGTPLFYGVAQEVDIATGKLVWQWDSREHVALKESYVAVPKTAPWDYFHMNSINVDPTDGNLIISGRNTWTFYKVERSSGKVLWRLGGKNSDFDVPAEAHFAFQHDVTPWPDGTITIFDNEGGPPAEASQSRALVLAVDQRSRKVSLAHQYRHTPAVVSWALGSVQEMANGSYFVGWGQVPYFSEYAPDGTVLLDGELTEGSVSYRAFKEPWQGTPKARPAIALAGDARSLTVYASWNGSTETANWVVMGGPSADRLSPLGRARRIGFETSISLSRAPSYIAVQAVSANGTVLGQSAAARVA